MSPGRQKVTDEDVFAAAQRAMTRQGPHELTLADIAAEAGVSAGRLVQRFGSKRALLLALSERFAGSAGPVFAGLRAAHASRWRRSGPTRRAWRTWRHSGGVVEEPRLPAGRSHRPRIPGSPPGKRPRDASRDRSTAESGRRAGELKRDVDARRLARTVETVIGGSLMTWACYREGRAATWMRRDLDAVLQPYVTPSRPSASRRPRHRRPMMMK